MAERPIRLFGDPVLRTSCDAIRTFDDALISLVADLEATVSVPGRAGLAANQIGVSRRVFAYHVDGQVGHVVNPVIEALEGDQEDEEGCLSIPGLWYPLQRARYARVRGADWSGRPVGIEGEGLLARCIQHEVDHLNGRLFSHQTLIQEVDDRQHRIELHAGQAVINPRGVWHTVDIHEPGSALFITPGRGTEHRPR